MTCQLVALVATRGHQPQPLQRSATATATAAAAFHSQLALYGVSCVFVCLPIPYFFAFLNMIVRTLIWPANEEYFQLIAVATKWRNSQI